VHEQVKPKYLKSEWRGGGRAANDETGWSLRYVGEWLS
jgi:hypothetical protein